MKEILGQTGEKPPNLIFPIMALLAGILGGVFGIGGGMLISPLLLHIGIPPEVKFAQPFWLFSKDNAVHPLMADCDW